MILLCKKTGKIFELCQFDRYGWWLYNGKKDIFTNYLKVDQNNYEFLGWLYGL